MPKPTDYDVFVDWEKRLAREAPFYRAVFEEAGVKSVADVGAGSAQMSLMFASWGMTVHAIDPDPGMLEQARANVANAQVDLPVYAGAFGDVARVVPGQVDAVVCAGNALPHVDGIRGLKTALADFAEVLRPGGVLVLHLLNHQRLLDSKVRAVPPVVRDTPDGTLVFQRVLDYTVPGGIGFDFITLHRVAEGAWEIVESRHSIHTALPAFVLVDELDHAGFTRIALFGNHQRKEFDAEKDESVIIVAHRAG